MHADRIHKAGSASKKRTSFADVFLSLSLTVKKNSFSYSFLFFFLISSEAEWSGVNVESEKSVGNASG